MANELYNHFSTIGSRINQEADKIDVPNYVLRQSPPFSDIDLVHNETAIIVLAPRWHAAMTVLLHF